MDGKKFLIKLYFNLDILAVKENSWLILNFQCSFFIEGRSGLWRLCQSMP